jgi:hypothetical protein
LPLGRIAKRFYVNTPRLDVDHSERPIESTISIQSHDTGSIIIAQFDRAYFVLETLNVPPWLIQDTQRDWCNSLTRPLSSPPRNAADRLERICATP